MSSKNAHKCIIRAMKKTMLHNNIKKYSNCCVCVEKKFYGKSSEHFFTFILCVIVPLFGWTDLNYNGNNNTVNGWNYVCLYSLCFAACAQCSLTQLKCHYKQQCYPFKIQIMPRNSKNGWKLRSQQVQKVTLCLCVGVSLKTLTLRKIFCCMYEESGTTAWNQKSSSKKRS